ncbi:MAG TPA: pyridoxine 5'-phosphate synthase, partial [Pseudomonadaceae bacterium]|nr:pyridoxine 5'-phosphate synthase [Pseudomonadaceae bacterium]
VPDSAEQLTSDHGWDCHRHREELRPVLDKLRSLGIRSSLFLEPSTEQAKLAIAAGADRIELYTEHYARAFHTPSVADELTRYRETAELATALGLGVNAGHDLDLQNLPTFLGIPGILEVSIGHALMIECIEQGLETVIGRYLAICKNPLNYI